MSAVSLAEVIGRLVRDGRPVNQVAERIAALEIEIYPLDAARAAAAAALQPSCQPLGLSLGDRCCLALAMELAVPALTADRTWLQLQPPGPAVIAIR